MWTGDLGNVSLGVLYGTVALTVFFAPAIVYACREKWTMLLGAVCYVVRSIHLPWHDDIMQCMQKERWPDSVRNHCPIVVQAYMASLIELVRWVVLVASVVIGFGAAILWVAQGSLLTLCSPKGHRGTHTGIFWFVVAFSSVSSSH